VLVERLEQQDLRRCTRVPPPEQARAEDARRVEDEYVAGSHELREVAKPAMLDRSRSAADDHQSALVAARDGCLRDAIRGEREIVVGGAGARLVSHPPGR
jgi:hypothetical protein